MLLVVAILTIFSGCVFTDIDLNKNPDAEKIAKEEFNVDEILFLANGNDNNNLVPQDFGTRYLIWVIGNRNNENVIIGVPAEKNKKAFEVDWLFIKSYAEILQEVSLAIEEIQVEEVHIESSSENIKKILDSSGLECTNYIEFAFVFNYVYMAVQVDGRIVILQLWNWGSSDVTAEVIK